jgi:hypothetical protein
VKKIYKKNLAGLAVGALLGYAYYYFIGCSSGHCPLTSNPAISTFYGAMIGFLFVFKPKPKKQ